LRDFRRQHLDRRRLALGAGDTIIRRCALRGEVSLTRLDRLIYCRWVVAYGMRSAGDLARAYDLCGSFHKEGRSYRESWLWPSHTLLFARSRADLEQRYFRRLAAICEELRAAKARR